MSAEHTEALDGSDSLPCVRWQFHTLRRSCSAARVFLQLPFDTLNTPKFKVTKLVVKVAQHVMGQIPPRKDAKYFLYREDLLRKRLDFVKHLNSDIRCNKGVLAQTVAAYSDILDGGPTFRA